jgi:hypothetical protein
MPISRLGLAENAINFGSDKYFFEAIRTAQVRATPRQALSFGSFVAPRPAEPGKRKEVMWADEETTAATIRSK